MTAMTPTDRELLEGAARAAGYSIQRSRLDDPMCRDMLLSVDRRSEQGEAIGWNPLADDGDALRLAVRLGMTVGQYNGNVFVGYGDDACEEVEPIGSDPYAATRRAITRAAYEIDRQSGREG